MEQNVCFKYILTTVNKVSITKKKTGPGAHPACYTWCYKKIRGI